MLAKLLVSLVALAILAYHWWQKPTRQDKEISRGSYPVLNRIRLLFYFIFCIVIILLLTIGTSEQFRILYIPFVELLDNSIIFVIELFGWIIFTLGWIFAFWGRTHLGNMWRPGQLSKDNLYSHHRLVTSGPYRLVRHPIYVGEILLLFGMVLLFRFWLLVFFAVDRVLLICMRIKYEEELLEKEFGELWMNYKKNVPKFIPLLSLKK